ncbi:MAG: hypothetical protein KDD40_09130 [Bdellovibrionales bacterium]|nr:hypothetical protein [Bdellovibrionales bacterium]
MEPRIKFFLILNGIIFTFVVFYVQYKRKKLGGDSEEASREELGFIGKINNDYHKQTQGTKKDYTKFQFQEINEANEEHLEASVRPISVIFTWNGHDWDAYEVLGLPVGSSIDEVNDAYEKALARVDEKSQEFIRKAYRSICQKVS